MTSLLLFISTFLSVFALGFQSLNVNNGHYKAAFFTSFLIGTSNLFLFKLVPNANGTEIAAYLSGGPIGIVCAMKFHGWFSRVRSPSGPNQEPVSHGATEPRRESHEKA